jgi:hypothetical protein
MDNAHDELNAFIFKAAGYGPPEPEQPEQSQENRAVTSALAQLKAAKAKGDETAIEDANERLDVAVDLLREQTDDRRPRNPDGTYAKFDHGARPVPPTQPSPNDFIFSSVTGIPIDRLPRRRAY